MGKKRNRLVTIGGLVGLICLFCACVSVFSPRRNQPNQPAATSKPLFTITSRPTTIAPTVTQTRNSIVPTATSAVVQATNTRAPAATQEPVNTQAPQPTQEPQPTATQAEPPTNPPPAFTVINITTPISAGSDASVTIQTTASASCFLSYTTPSGAVSDAQGLGATTADGSGICTWTWRIGPRTNPGTGSLGIRANGVTQYYPIEIQ